MRAAILLASVALFAAPAYAQSNSDQTQLRGAYSNVTVTVGHAADVGATAVAGGNAISQAGDHSDADLDVRQRMEGDANATTNSTVWGADGTVSISSAAVSNGATATAVNGNVDARATQITHGDARAATNVVTGGVGSAASSASGGGNVAALAAESGDIRGDINQASTGSVSAATNATHCCVGGDVVADAVASANNVSAAGSTTTLLTNTNQSATGASVEARVGLNSGSASNAVGNATANANAVTIDNAWGYVNARARQDASANVYARSTVTLGGDFGLGSASAYGVGNSAIVGNVASDTVLDVGQNNRGDVDASAALDGGNGDQALASSAASGNVVTGALCTYCDNTHPDLNASTTQTNAGDVTSSASVTANRARTVAASASAIGNAASYQVIGTN